MSNRKAAFYILLTILTLADLSCKKSDSAPGTGTVTFIKEYDMGSYTFNTSYIEQMPDGGYLILGYNGAGTKSLLLRLSKYGNLDWKREVGDDSFVTEFVHPLGDGTYIINDNNHFRVSKIDTFGRVLTYNQFGQTGTDILNNQPLQNGPGGTYMISISTGGYAGSSQNTVLHFDHNLNYTGQDDFNDSNYFSGKSITFGAYQENASGSFNVFGEKLLKQNWNWSDPRKLYFAKVAKGKKTAIAIIDSAEQYVDENPYWYIVNPDSSIVVVCQRIDYAINKSTPFIVKVDKNLKVDWETNIQEANKNILTRIVSPLSDGGYVITGSTNNGTNGTLPYELKLDANGNKVWSRTVAIPGNSTFDLAIPCSDGGVIFVGATTGFGNGKGKQGIFVKTDANGNL